MERGKEKKKGKEREREGSPFSNFWIHPWKVWIFNFSGSSHSTQSASGLSRLY